MKRIEEVNKNVFRASENEKVAECPCTLSLETAKTGWKVRCLKVPSLEFQSKWRHSWLELQGLEGKAEITLYLALTWGSEAFSTEGRSEWYRLWIKNRKRWCLKRCDSSILKSDFISKDAD